MKNGVLNRFNSSYSKLIIRNINYISTYDKQNTDLLNIFQNYKIINREVHTNGLSEKSIVTNELKNIKLNHTNTRYTSYNVNTNNNNNMNIYACYTVIYDCIQNNDYNNLLFHDCCLEIERNTVALDTSSLIKMYNICHKISPSNSNLLNLYKSLKLQLEWNIPRMSLANILIIKKEINNEQDTLYKLCQERYNQLTNDIKTAKDLLLLLHEDDTHLNKVADFVEDMTLKQLYRVGVILAKKGQRSKPLLRTYTIKLKQLLENGNDLSIFQLGNLLLVYTQLNIYDGHLFSLITSHLINGLKKVSYIYIYTF